MRPNIPISNIIDEARHIVGQEITTRRQATAGADHFVIFATSKDGQELVIKAGPEANVDAFVLKRLAQTPVPVPALIGCAPIEHDGERHYVTIMTPAEGILLAEAPDLGRYLPQLVSAMRSVHGVTTTQGAGLVLAVEEGRGQSWTGYLDDLLSGSHPDFPWAMVAQHPAIDASKLNRALVELRRHIESLPEIAAPSLLHGDLNPFNIFGQNGQITGIIDWSYARYGDPLFDFARLRMNGVIRKHDALNELYVQQLHLTEDEAAREQVYYWFHLLEYVNWYVQDGHPERAREHLHILDQEIP